MVNQKRGYLVAYDVSDDYRRSHVAKILQHYGERLQYRLTMEPILLCSAHWGQLRRRKRDWIFWGIEDMQT